MASVAAKPNERGYQLVYRENESNRCPSCGRANWHVGRLSAECGFCGTALTLAESTRIGPSPEWRVPDGSNSWANDWLEQRGERRLRTRDRTLRLVAASSSFSFQLQNLSSSGVKGSVQTDLDRGQTVHVELENGIRIPALVRWTKGSEIGLEFTTRVPLEITSRR